MTTTISSKGQITVPAKIRKALALRPGVKLAIRMGKNSSFIVTKAAEKSFFAQFKGICAHRSPWKNGDEAMEDLRGSVPRGDVKAR